MARPVLMPTSLVKVHVRVVNGRAWDFEMPWSFVVQARAMQARGVEDWRIVNELITDDWGAPPLVVEVTGTGPDGKPVALTLRYDRPR